MPHRSPRDKVVNLRYFFRRRNHHNHPFQTLSTPLALEVKQRKFNELESVANQGLGPGLFLLANRCVNYFGLL